MICRRCVSLERRLADARVKIATRSVEEWKGRIALRTRDLALDNAAALRDQVTRRGMRIRELETEVALWRAKFYSETSECWVVRVSKIDGTRGYLKPGGGLTDEIWKAFKMPSARAAGYARDISSCGTWPGVGWTEVVKI